jgi:membrane protease YdiL (CAAX protease family)
MAARLASILARIGEAEEPPPWGIVSAVYTMLVALIAMFVGTFVALAVLGETLLAGHVNWIIGCVLAVGFVALTYRHHREALRLDVPVGSLILILLVSFGLAIAFDLLSLAVTNVFLSVPELQSLYGRPVDAVNWIAAAALMVIAQPIAEEVVFRGIVFPSFRSRFGAWPGLVLCALTYALFHFIAYSSAPNDPVLLWYALVLPFLAGLVISAIRGYTGSTRAAIVSHMAFGLFAVLKAFTLAG